MQPVEGILFEPVGCLAEFPAEPFIEIAARFFGAGKSVTRSGSRAYWHLLNLMQASGRVADEIDDLEVEAVSVATVYEDVGPALSELAGMGIQLLLVSSLSTAALTCFRKKCSFCDFSQVVSRGDAGGFKDAPLRVAIDRASLQPERTMFLTDTAEGIKVAKVVGINAVLMMNDPDEAKRLTTQDPAGGIVSLLELPDFVRLVAARNR